MNSKIINEESKTYFLINTRIDPPTGSKEVEISTTIHFFNNLGKPVEIGFKRTDADPLNKQLLKKRSDINS